MDNENLVFSMNERVQKLMEKALEYHGIENYIKALEYYSKALKIEPNNDKILCERCDAFVALSQFDNAFDDINKAIEINKTADYLNDLGGIYAEMENYEMALTHYNAVIEIDKTNQFYYFNRAEAYFILNKFYEAIDDSTKAINLHDEDNFTIASYFLRGLSYWALKLYDKAISDFEKFDELNYIDGNNLGKNPCIMDILEEKEGKVINLLKIKSLWSTRFGRKAK